MVLVTPIQVAAEGDGRVKKKEPSVKKAVFAKSPFDSSVQTLPPNFWGHSVIDIAQAAQKIRVPKRGEFETTEQFKAREDSWRSAPLSNALTASSTLAFRFHTGERGSPFQAKYLVDSSVWVFDSTIIGRRSYELPRDLLGLEWFRFSQNAGSFIGQNAFGVRRKISVEVLTITDVAIPLSSMSRVSARIEMAVDRAKTMNLAALLVGKLRPPFVGFEERTNSATISEPFEQRVKNWMLVIDPEEVIVYNIPTGEIIGRFSAKDYFTGLTN